MSYRNSYYHEVMPKSDDGHANAIMRQAITKPYSYFEHVTSQPQYSQGQGRAAEHGGGSPAHVECRTPSPAYYDDVNPSDYASAGIYSPPMQRREALASTANGRSPRSDVDECRGRAATTTKCQPSAPIRHCTSSFLAKPTKKGVTFKPTATVRMYSSNLTDEEKSRLYYSKQDVNTFNLELNAICTLSQGLPAARASGTQSIVDLSAAEGNDTDSLRGLELLLYPKRRQNKLLARKSLLKYQSLLDERPSVTPERKRAALAAACAKLNLWSSLVALETARLDALRAYEGERLAPSEYPRPVPIVPPLVRLLRKRQRGTMGDKAGTRSGIPTTLNRLDGTSVPVKKRRIGQR